MLRARISKSMPTFSFRIQFTEHPAQTFARQCCFIQLRRKRNCFASEIGSGFCNEGMCAMVCLRELFIIPGVCVCVCVFIHCWLGSGGALFDIASNPKPISTSVFCLAMTDKNAVCFREKRATHFACMCSGPLCLDYLTQINGGAEVFFLISASGGRWTFHPERKLLYVCGAPRHLVDGNAISALRSCTELMPSIGHAKIN